MSWFFSKAHLSRITITTISEPNQYQIIKESNHLTFESNCRCIQITIESNRDLILPISGMTRNITVIIIHSSVMLFKFDNVRWYSSGYYNNSLPTWYGSDSLHSSWWTLMTCRCLVRQVLSLGQTVLTVLASRSPTDTHINTRPTQPWHPSRVGRSSIGLSG